MQVGNYCTPASFSCQSSLAKKDFGCLDFCHGFYADVLHTTTDVKREQQEELESIEEEYKKYKAMFAKNIVFERDSFSSGKKKNDKRVSYERSSERIVPYSPLQSVRILLSTATFDVAEKYDKYDSLFLADSQNINSLE